MLGQRVITAIVLLAVCLAGLFLAPAPLWATGVAALFAVGAAEWARLIGRVPVRGALLAAAVAATCFVVLVDAALPWLALGWGLATLWWLAVAPLQLATGARVRASGMAGGWLVLAPSGAALVWLAADPWQLLCLLAIPWIADTGAYFAGRAFGRRRLAPSISPGKTVEGAIGGAIAVALYVALLQGFLIGKGHPLAGTGGWLLAITLLALSIVGDLYESLAKRQAGVKDSGTLLPGHGGVLDRIDALTSTLPVAALAVYIQVHSAT